MARRIHQTPPSSLTATQCVLSTPELVSEILHWDADGYKEPGYKQRIGYNNDQTFPKNRFASYARVNTLWFHQAMRYLWWTPLPYSKLRTLERLPLERRQVYTNFVVDLTLPNYFQSSCKESRILERLKFPRLRFAKIGICPGQRLLSLPGIRGDVLQDLTIDVWNDDVRRGGPLSDNKMQKRLAIRLMKTFPRLKKITITAPSGAPVSPGDLARFQANFTGVHSWGVQREPNL
ncbi:Protein VAC14 [Penicillium cataractarum]|uniref:Protein VAC14 n=1 Tax=Penicillium cataractarum TaxID=2100454 RepID=A0A9W9SJS5_9EURO|nr:Protein VAC14 [Penicillium cataractarum]KAJ5379876.1 Protein VAC14 [Penicillium cataractarum]